ncbi:MAG: hypothetical protein LUC33_06300 [Prevotellaceae bacterium]|nr:hypothetical protein [Prevotellaceae bacterium]
MKKYLTILFTLACALCAAPANAESSWTAPTPTGSTLDTSTSFYLYNVGAQAFMTNVTVTWGTTAGFGDYSTALACTMTAISDGDRSGSYTITDTYGTDYYLFDDGSYYYVDGGSNSTQHNGKYFYFTAVSGETNAYTIYCNGNDDRLGSSFLMGYDGTDAYIANLSSETEGDNVHWLLVDASLLDAEYTLYSLLVEAEAMGMTEDNDAYKSAGDTYTDTSSSVDDITAVASALKTAMLAIATPENAVDVTDDYIVDPDFSDGNSESKWVDKDGTALTTTGDWKIETHNYSGVNGAAIIGKFAQGWVPSGYLGEGNFHQIIEDLPAGEYTLTADIVASDQHDNSAEPTEAYFYAGDNQVEITTNDGVPETFSLTFLVSADNNSSIAIGAKTTSDTNVSWMCADNFKLYYVGTEENYDKYELEQLIAEAQELAALEYTGYDELTTAIATAQTARESASSADDYTTALATLQEAIDTYKATNASKFGGSVGTEIEIENPDASDGTNGWTIDADGDALGTLNGEHWSGHSWRTYFDHNSASTLWQGTMTQEVTLTEAGVYKLTAAARSSEGAKVVLLAGEMEYEFPAVGNTGGTIDTDGNTWESVEAGVAEGASFANSNVGYGWNWGSIEIIVPEDNQNQGTTLTIGAKMEDLSGTASTWCSVGDFKLEYLGEESVALDKDALSLAIEEASEVDVTTNVGSDAFQRSQDLADELTSAIEEAQKVYDDESATTESIESALTALQKAVTAFLEAELNAPEDGQTFNIIMMAEDSNCQGNALWVVRDDDTKSSQGYYNVQFDYEPSASLENQCFTFTPVQDVTNGYTLSFNVDPSTVTGDTGDDATTRYICYAEKYSGTSTGTAGFRVTATADDACTFQVIATETDGIVKLFNPDQKANVGINGNNGDAGFYTDNTYSDLSIVSASDEITWEMTSAGYGTLMLPFVPTDDELTGLTLYTTSAFEEESADEADADDTATVDDDAAADDTTEEAEETDSKTLDLVEVTDGFKANTPYIVTGDEAATYTFAVTARTYVATVTSEDSWLTGAYTTVAAPEGSYVLQNQASGVAFYIVNSDDISLTANHCYLTVASDEQTGNDETGNDEQTGNDETGNDAPEVIFLFPTSKGNATAIESVETVAETDGEAVYDLSGRKVSQPLKGIYIKGGKKVVIK